MDKEQTIECFGDLVAAAERLTAPWRRALALTNILWAFAMVGVVAVLIC